MSKINHKTRTILQELTTYRVPKQDILDALDSRAMHVIKSAISLIEEIEENMTVDETDFLIKRFYSAIRNKDESRFTRATQQVKKDRKKNE